APAVSLIRRYAPSPRASPLPLGASSLPHPTPPTHIHPLSLHDALPIYYWALRLIPNVDFVRPCDALECAMAWAHALTREHRGARPEDPTSKLHSLTNLVCRLLLSARNVGPDRKSTPLNTRH